MKLLKNLSNYQINLASGSPRRQALFKQLKIPFKSVTKPIIESYPSDLKAEEITNFLVKKKFQPFIKNLSNNDLIITADTIVWHKNKSLEKPKNKLQAIAMIEALSNQKHTVITSVGIKTIAKEIIFCDKTDVYFKKLSIDEINYYVNHYNPIDKAGAYGIQEWIGLIGVTKIEGSYFNVMGLPVHKLYNELKKI